MSAPSKVPINWCSLSHAWCSLYKERCSFSKYSGLLNIKRDISSNGTAYRLKNCAVPAIWGLNSNEKHRLLFNKFKTFKSFKIIMWKNPTFSMVFLWNSEKAHYKPRKNKKVLPPLKISASANALRATRPI